MDFLNVHLFVVLILCYILKYLVACSIVLTMFILFYMPNRHVDELVNDENG